MDKKLPPPLRIILICLTAIGLSAVMAFAIFYARKNISGTDPASQIPLYQTLLYATPAVKIPMDSETSTPPLGVMIENELSARPYQIGLGEASIVYEAPAEAGITRFLALFTPESYSGKLGPVRSARSYFLDWIYEYNAVIAHVGGSKEAINRLAKEPVLNADQFFNEDYFWRENVGKTALEHTMFTTGEKLHELITDNSWVWNIPAHLVSKKEYPQIDIENYPGAESISIDFGTYYYRILYEYDPALDLYIRYQAKKNHIVNSENTADGKKQIAPGTVVVQRVNAWPTGLPDASIKMKTIDSGESVVFTKGRAIKGIWKKESLEAPTLFFDDNGNEIKLDKGPVWIEIVPLYNTVNYK